MKTKFLLPLLLIALPFFESNAGIIYRVEQTKISETDSFEQTLAQRRRFYIGGMYNYSMWSDYTNDQDIKLSGKNASSFELVAGMVAFCI